MQRGFLIGGAAALCLGVLAAAQTLEPEAEPETSGQAVMAGLSAEELADEEAYLRTYLGEQIDVSDIEPIPGVVNEPYRNCPKTPEMREVNKRAGAPGHRAYRDISLYLSRINVITKRECDCATKVIPDVAVRYVENELQEAHGVDTLTPHHTRHIFEESQRLGQVAKALCGGDF